MAQPLEARQRLGACWSPNSMQWQAPGASCRTIPMVLQLLSRPLQVLPALCRSNEVHISAF